MTQWALARERGEQKRQELYPTSLTFNGIQVTCTGTSKEGSNKLERNDIMPERPVVFTLLSQDFARLQIHLRSVVESIGLKFQVFAIQEDDADATVDLRCTLYLGK